MFRVEDFVELKSNEIVKLQRIFIHCLQYENVRRFFFWIWMFIKLSYKNQILNLKFLQLTETDRIVFLFWLKAEKPYIVQIVRHFNSTSSKSFSSFNNELIDHLHCTWKIKFLWLFFWLSYYVFLLFTQCEFIFFAVITNLQQSSYKNRSIRSFELIYFRNVFIDRFLCREREFTMIFFHDLSFTNFVH